MKHHGTGSTFFGKGIPSMQERTAPPIACYLWYYARQPKRLVDRNSALIICKKSGTRYRVVQTAHSAWLYYLILLPGFYMIFTYRYPNFVVGLLLAIAVGFLADVLPGLYSYYRTTFEEVREAEEP